MFGDGGYIGGMVHRRFDSGNARVRVVGSPASLTVSVAGGNMGDSYDFAFAAPRGRSLVAGGVYTDAQRTPFRDPGRPGIEISGSGRGCNKISGLFQVKDIARNSGGRISRLWIVYEHHCERWVPAEWGEIKIGEQAHSGLLIEPGIVRWPTTDVGLSATTVPVTAVAARGAVTVASASVAGPAAGDFQIKSDECGGRALGAGDSCQVWLRFAPRAPGTRRATLRIVDRAGATHAVLLQGFAFGGTTRAEFRSEPGDYIGKGRDWSYTLSNARIVLSGNRSYAAIGVSGVDGSGFGAEFAAAPGDILRAGASYPNARRYAFNPAAPGLPVTSPGRACNSLTGSFTVRSVTFDRHDQMESAAITFEQHCEGGTPALRGTLEYRVGDGTPLAPWLRPSTGAPPQTRITGGPPKTTSSRRATFQFVSSKPRSTFQCRLDSGRWSPCRSPKTFTGLRVGAHRLLVRARDQAGRPDPTPARRTWRIH